jgi:two-component system sensor histidine kinase/response regulator
LYIMVAEDNEYNAEILEQHLVRRVHRVRLAKNGREALNIAKDAGFDLLPLDVHMPEPNGSRVVQAIRVREQAVGGHLPVIALTARSRKEDRERCLAVGMDDFLLKPVRAADLWTAIDRVVRARPQAERPRAALLARACCGMSAGAMPSFSQFGTMAAELMRLTGSLSLENLRRQAEVAEGPDRTASP